MLPQRVEELKLSAARAGAITALSRAKAWQAELDPEELASGFPRLKEDGSPFEAIDFTNCVKQMRHLARQLAEETNLSKYHAAYTKENSRMPAAIHETTNLIPPNP